MNTTKKIVLAALTCLPLLGTSVMAKQPDIVNIPKIGGMPWFNRMGEGVKEAGKDYNINAYQVGPSSTDAGPYTLDYFLQVIGQVMACWREG